MLRSGRSYKISRFSVIRWVFNCGRGTNTKAELMGAWATLSLALHLSIKRLQILGDSKVVIEWLSNRGSLQVCAIEGWKARIRDMIRCFDVVSFDHIFRNSNRDANLLSKQALGEPEGSIIYYPWSNGIAGHKSHISLY
jgi:ribonuclease HI